MDACRCEYTVEYLVGEEKLTGTGEPLGKNGCPRTETESRKPQRQTARPSREERMTLEAAESANFRRLDVLNIDQHVGRQNEVNPETKHRQTGERTAYCCSDRFVREVLTWSGAQVADE